MDRTCRGSWPLALVDPPDSFAPFRIPSPDRLYSPPFLFEPILRNSGSLPADLAGPDSIWVTKRSHHAASFRITCQCVTAMLDVLSDEQSSVRLPG